MESFGIREIIRSTWASKHEINDKSVSFIFMVGMSDSKYLNKQLAIEGKLYDWCHFPFGSPIDS